MPERLAARQPQRPERPCLGQPRKHRTAQSGTPGEILQRAEGLIAPRLFDPLAMGGRQAVEHVQAQTESEVGSGQRAVGSGEW